MHGNKFDILKAQKNKIWKWPAVVNMSVGATAAGHFLFSAADTMLPVTAQPVPTQVMYMAAPLLMIIGLATMSLEIGKPRHIIFVLANLKSSWMSREVLAAGLFILLAVAAGMTDVHGKLFSIMASGAALAYIISQGMLVCRCLAVSFWSNWRVVLFFFVSAMVSGFAFFTLACRFLGLSVPSLLFWTGISLIMLNAIIWGSFIRSPNAAAIRKLRSPAGITVILGFGHIVPLLLLVFIRLFAVELLTPAKTDALVVLSAGAVLLGAIAQKFILIKHAALLDGVSLPESIECFTERLSEI